MLLKKDVNKLVTIFKRINLNDLILEEYAGELEEKSSDYYEKGNEERSDSYQEASEALTELVEAYQRLQSLLEDNGEEDL